MYIFLRLAKSVTGLDTSPDDTPQQILGYMYRQDRAENGGSCKYSSTVMHVTGLLICAAIQIEQEDWRYPRMVVLKNTVVNMHHLLSKGNLVTHMQNCKAKQLR